MLEARQHAGEKLGGTLPPGTQIFNRSPACTQHSSSCFGYVFCVGSGARVGPTRVDSGNYLIKSNEKITLLILSLQPLYWFAAIRLSRSLCSIVIMFVSKVSSKSSVDHRLILSSTDSVVNQFICCVFFSFFDRGVRCRPVLASISRFQLTQYSSSLCFALM